MINRRNENSKDQNSATKSTNKTYKYKNEEQNKLTRERERERERKKGKERKGKDFTCSPTRIVRRKRSRMKKFPSPTRPVTGLSGHSHSVSLLNFTA
jgi:hypothetical protein